jgi:hypothetical protein
MSDELARLAEALRSIFPAGEAIDRKRCVAGLEAVVEFLEHANIDSGNAIIGLADLATAVADLDRGIVHPMLRKVGWDRPPDRSDIWMARSDAAIGVEFLLRTGMSKKDIWTKAVEPRQAALGRLVRTNANLQTSVLRWNAVLNRAEGVVIVDFIERNNGLDRCYHMGIAMLDRASRRAMGLMVDADPK